MAVVGWWPPSCPTTAFQPSPNHQTQLCIDSVVADDGVELSRDPSSSSHPFLPRLSFSSSSSFPPLTLFCLSLCPSVIGPIRLSTSDAARSFNDDDDVEFSGRLAGLVLIDAIRTQWAHRFGHQSADNAQVSQKSEDVAGFPIAQPSPCFFRYKAKSSQLQSPVSSKRTMANDVHCAQPGTSKDSSSGENGGRGVELRHEEPAT